MIAQLRFVERDNRKRLQMATEATVVDGKVVWNWQDVPFVPREFEEEG